VLTGRDIIFGGSVVGFCQKGIKSRLVKVRIAQEKNIRDFEK